MQDDFDPDGMSLRVELDATAELDLDDDDTEEEGSSDEELPGK